MTDKRARRKKHHRRTMGERYFRALYDNSLDGILLTVPESGEVVAANPAACSMLGMTEDEIRHLGRRIVVEDEALAEALKERAAHGRWRGELRFRRKNGSVFPVEVSSSLFIDNQGTTMSSMSLRDITGQKRAEEELRRYELILKHSRDIVLSIQYETGRILQANYAAVKAYGYTREELLSLSVRDLRAPDTLSDISSQMSTADSEGILFYSYHKRKDGTLFPVEVSSQGATLAGERILISVVRDITSRQQAEKALRESEERFTKVFYRNPSPMTITHPFDQRLIDANDSFLDLFGYSREEAVGHKIIDDLHLYVDPDDRKKFFRIFEQYGSVMSYEVRMRNKEGKVLTILLSSELVVFARERNVACTTFVDITGRKLTEEALRKSHEELERRVEERTTELRQAYERLVTETQEREQLEEHLRQAQKMEAVGRLAGGIAHDFNNMLAVIMGNAELALDDVNHRGTASSHIEQIMKASRRARDLIKQILAFSRKTEAQRSSTHVIPLVKETFNLLRGTLPSTVRMDLSIKTENDLIISDPTQIQQILMNLTMNAVDAMKDQGGILTVSIDHVAMKKEEMPDSEMQAGHYLKLTVDDTGVGIEKEVHDRIFEPFFTTKDVGLGTGMGLAVVYGIVKSHGGCVTVQSKPGNGSSFDVYLPLATATVKGQQDEGEDVPRAHRNERILLVDDEPQVVEATALLLQSLGYRVTTAANATEAWDQFQKEQSGFDLVITDQTMPDLTGLDLAKRMLQVRKDIPIILFTGYSEAVSSESTTSIGVSGYLMKPTEKREVATAVRRALDRQSK